MLNTILDVPRCAPCLLTWLVRWFPPPDTTCPDDRHRGYEHRRGFKYGPFRGLVRELECWLGHRGIRPRRPMSLNLHGAKARNGQRRCRRGLRQHEALASY